MSITPFEALHVVRPQLVELPVGSLLAVNADLQKAAETALGSMPELVRLKGTIGEVFGPTYVARVDDLELLALAMIQANAGFGPTAGAAATTRLSDQLVKRRDLLELELRSIVSREVLPETVFPVLKGNVGYRNQVLDSLRLTTVLREHWSTIAGRTMLTEDDLTQAEALAGELTRAAGLRDVGEAPNADSVELRQRAFTLFFRTYEEVRRAVHFLRWFEGDADAILPSIHAARGARTSRDEDSTDAAPTTPTTATPATPTTATPTTATPTTTTTSAPVPVGYPGSEPFLR